MIHNEIFLLILCQILYLLFDSPVFLFFAICRGIFGEFFVRRIWGCFLPDFFEGITHEYHVTLFLVILHPQMLGIAFGLIIFGWTEILGVLGFDLQFHKISKFGDLIWLAHEAKILSPEFHLNLLHESGDPLTVSWVRAHNQFSGPPEWSGHRGWMTLGGALTLICEFSTFIFEFSLCSCPKSWNSLWSLDLLVKIFRPKTH